MSQSILQPNASYTFPSYFEMNYLPDEILAEFGYSLKKDPLILPQTQKTLDQIPELRRILQRNLLLVSLTNESARQQTLVAPILLEVADIVGVSLRIEYPLIVNNWLKGNLDYFLKTRDSLLVVEAKNSDLTRGFVQMAVELIAVSQIEEDRNLFYGVVTIGEIWKFGVLDKSQQLIKEDLKLYRVIDDLEPLINSLVGILN